MNGMQKINDNFFVDKTKSLGKGNFGVVYKGYRLDENRIIAVKFIDKHQLQKNEDYKRELVVMEDLAKLNHPNIMGYYGYENTTEGLYCFLEFCAGGELKQHLKKKISEIKVMSLLKQLLLAMSYINQQNKVHRDLKPDNILLDQNLDLKIADFGLARDVQVIMTKGACTPLYAAPEVYNLQEYDQKCDVWSAGLILYEMLTGHQMFEKIKTKAALREELEKFKKSHKMVNYPKELHQFWTDLTQKMLTYDKKQRPSFDELLKYFETIKQKMQQDLNKKYDIAEGAEDDITNSRKRLALINPYLSRQRNDKNSPQLKLQEETSYQKYQMAQRYLMFLRMKTDFMCKIIKSFTDNPYAILKNVYKYILMFLAVSCYISRLTESLLQLKNKQVNTPEGMIETKDIAEPHQKEWEALIADFKTKHTLSIERFRSVLEKQIVEKITKSYMNRDEQKKILNSYNNLVTWIEETKKGNFMKAKFYTELYIKVMNDDAVHVSDQKLKTLELKDLKTYSYIRLTGQLDAFLVDENFKDQDYIRVKKQELQNLQKAELPQYLQRFNHR